MATRTLTFGSTTYPLALPNVKDPAHVAAVMITIHVLGQVALGFQVSVPQILAAILTFATLEVGLAFWEPSFVWPASAMLTGSGVALILRVVGTPSDDHWTTHRWYMYAVVAGNVARHQVPHRVPRGSHVFNPSNIGLVAAFIVLGSTRVEPLDFWWAPLNGWMSRPMRSSSPGGC